MEVSSLFDVRGKVAVVSGGATGIGAMITRALATNGAHVVVVSRKPVPDAFADLAGKAGSLEFIPADLSKDEECKRVAELVQKKHQKVHILVNNSGCSWGSPLEKYPYMAFEKVYRLNVFGVFALIKYLIPALEKSGSSADPARIINIGSVNGVSVPHLETYAYSSSKAALHMLTKTLGSRLAPRHINVNAILPGPFLTKMTAAAFKDPSNDVLESVPMGRLGRDNDMAGAILYLSSKASNYVTGALIPVGGGALVSPRL